LLTAGVASAQMVGGFQSAPGSAAPATTVTTRPSSAYSNPYTNNGVATGGVNPYAAAGQTVTPYGMYATPLPATPSTMPVSGAEAAQPGTYGAEGQPAAPPRYSIESAPVSGPYATPQPGYTPQYGAPQFAQPYSQPYAPAYAPQYAPPQYGQPYPAQYAPQPQPQYAQPQQAPPQYGAQPQAGMASQAGVTSQAMSPAYNQIPSPYAAMRNAAAPVAQGPAGAPGQMIEGGYTLGPGDKVRVTVFGEQDLSGEYQLDGNGNIRIPLAGVVRAAGYTAQGLEGWLYAALVPNYLKNPRINVEITRYRPVYVVGQVTKPGQYDYVHDMTLLQAIALAGGFNQEAKQSEVYLRREGEVKEQLVPTAQPLLIRPGDTVRVDTTIFWDAMNLFAPLSGPAYLAK
jgi:polysaccharide export outer membrane protein